MGAIHFEIEQKLNDFYFFVCNHHTPFIESCWKWCDLASFVVFEKSVFGRGGGGGVGVDMIRCVDRGSKALLNAIGIVSIRLLMSVLWAVESFGGVLLSSH